VYLDDSSGASQTADYSQVSKCLDSLSKRLQTGPEALEYASKTIGSKYLRRGLNKNLNVGVGAKTFNKVVKEKHSHFTSISEQEAPTYQELHFESGQTWSDLKPHFGGTWFIQGYFKGIPVQFTTNSQGKVVSSCSLGYGVGICNVEHIIAEIEALNFKEYTITGKLFFENFDKTIELLKTPSDKVSDKLVFHISELDANEALTCGGPDYSFPYKKRIEWLHNICGSNYVKTCYTEKVNFQSKEQLKKLQDLKYEGYLIIDGDWEYGCELIYGKYQFTANPALPKKRQVWRHKFN